MRGWLGAAVLAAVGVAGCRRERVPPHTPPVPKMEDVSNMSRAGFPQQQGIPSGNNGEGIGGSGTSAGQGSAVKELTPGVPINVGVPGEKNPAEQPKEQGAGGGRAPPAPPPAAAPGAAGPATTAPPSGPP